MIKVQSNPDIFSEPIIKQSQIVNVVRPLQDDQSSLPDLLEILEENKEEIDEMLLRHGAVLFRDFKVNNKEEFLRVKGSFAGGNGFDYVDGNSPRTRLSAGVYTSTEYPKDYSISLHNELSYSSRWPAHILFFCQLPSVEGGETPLLDGRVLLEHLDPVIVSKFEELGVRYTRYLAGTKGVGKTWMDTFETTDRSCVEKYCLESNIDFSWEGNSLYITQYGPGILEHPVTKEKVWFNQANQFHPSALPEDIYRMLKMLHSKDRKKFPQYAFFGNGEEIPEEFLKEITAIQFETALTFPWKKGDVLLLDNILMAHGRMPYKGERKICVSMC